MIFFFCCFVWSYKCLWCQAAHWGLFQLDILTLEDEDDAGAVSGCHTGVTDTPAVCRALFQGLEPGSQSGPPLGQDFCTGGQPWLCIYSSTAFQGAGSSLGGGAALQSIKTPPALPCLDDMSCSLAPSCISSMAFCITVALETS